MAEATAILELKDINRCYESASVLNGVSLSINTGDSVAIVGPSGCGKSTLLNIIGALDKPDNGSCTFGGKNIAGLNEEDLARFRNTSVGFIFQAHHLLPQCTVLENVLIPTLVTKTDAAFRDRAMQLLDRVGLADRANDMPGKLSGGECQRVAVVRALINKPRLLLADEPTGSLSRSGAIALTDLLLDLNRDEGMTLIVVTHALSVAQKMERVYRLDDGVLSDYTGGDV